MAITNFKGQNRWLSNFAEVDIFYKHHWFKSTEHAYMANKIIEEDHPDIFHAIKNSMSAKDAKKLGNTEVLKKKGYLRSDWYEVQLQIMEDVLRLKFDVPNYHQQLMLTYPQELIEGNTWHDNFFGTCTCEKCGNKGLNHLGKLIMKIRDEKHASSH
jgi:ribA/ribD-fused uncharacterized protein